MAYFYFLGVERAATEQRVGCIGDVPFPYMPFSDSILTMLGVASAEWLMKDKVFTKPDIGFGIGMGRISRLELGLINHDHDIAIESFFAGPKFSSSTFYLGLTS